MAASRKTRQTKARPRGAGPEFAAGQIILDKQTAETSLAHRTKLARMHKADPFDTEGNRVLIGTREIARITDRCR